MNTIHDLGGMDGFTIAERDQGRILKTEWERQVWGLLRSLRIPGYSTGGRAALESMAPELYLSLSYYARFLWRAEQSLIAGGFVTEEELANPDGPVTMPDIPNFVAPGPEETVARFARDTSAELLATVPPLFAVGDVVVVNNEHPAGHTRVPRYVRSHQGVIHRHHGVHHFQDDVGGQDVGQQHLYTVMFTGPELWGSRAHANDRIYVELWDYHLKPGS